MADFGTTNGSEFPELGSVFPELGVSPPPVNGVGGNWAGDTWIPNYSGPSLYGYDKPVPYYYYGPTPGQYYMDQAYGGMDPGLLNAWAKTLGADDFGRLSYVMSFFPQSAQPTPPPGTNPNSGQPSYYSPTTRRFEYMNNLANEPQRFQDQIKRAQIASQYGMVDPTGSFPDYARVMGALKAQGWDPGMGYGPQDWAALRAKTFGPNSAIQGTDVDPKALDVNKMYNDLLSLLTPNNGKTSFPLNPDIPTPPAPANNSDDQLRNDAYLKYTLGGGYYGGVIPQSMRSSQFVPSNPWGTLNSMGFNQQLPWSGTWSGNQPGLGTASTSQSMWGQNPQQSHQQSWGSSPWETTPSVPYGAPSPGFAAPNQQNNAFSSPWKGIW